MKLGKFTILETIGKGGMGEVFLAQDPVCERTVALKRMRGRWMDNPTMKKRFLKEAKIAASLSHPSIIPIYSIDEQIPFYTMPHVAGETLKEILTLTRDQARKGEPQHPIGSSVPSLIRIFMSVCGAVAYAHHKDIVHRDLKPENIIVGDYKEVIILDWGLAQQLGQNEAALESDVEEEEALTKPGKIPGTLLYMAPERAFGAKSSILTDIYSLGVVLYQILTLQFPFQRKSMKEFRKFHEHETILPPEELAPERDISPHLSAIVAQCLAKDPEDRYQTMEALIADLENYIRGEPEWLATGVLDPQRNHDWLLKENIALSSHTALTRGIDMLQWVNLMVSKGGYSGNIKIEAELKLLKGSEGVGILFSIPETNLHQAMEEGYCLWMSPKALRLFRMNVEVVHIDSNLLAEEKTHQIRIEYVEGSVKLFVDGVLMLRFLSHIPLSGSSIGLMTRDEQFTLTPMQIFGGSQNIQVNCLAIPDAFLARKQYDDALFEYRKIAHSFPGRAEGREAIFRSGMTLLQQSKEQKTKKGQTDLFAQAFEEFEKLHHTPGAPLEYLGKSYVYKAQEEYDEEVKCLELALRKFPKHPLKPILVEHILSRLHESSKQMRQVAYRFALILLRYLPEAPEAKTITEILEKNLEPLPFFTPSPNTDVHLLIQLAFWLNKPLTLVELIEKELDPIDKTNAHIALHLLGCENLADETQLEATDEPIIRAQFELALLNEAPFPETIYPLWQALHNKEWKVAKELCETLTQEQRDNPHDPHFFLYGCYLAKEEGKEKAEDHLTNISEEAHPRTPTLLSHYLKGRIALKKGWMERAFYWEKVKLFQQLELYALCLEDSKLYKMVKSLYKNL